MQRLNRFEISLISRNYGGLDASCRAGLCLASEDGIEDDHQFISKLYSVADISSNGIRGYQEY